MRIVYKFNFYTLYTNIHMVSYIIDLYYLLFCTYLLFTYYI